MSVKVGQIVVALLMTAAMATSGIAVAQDVSPVAEATPVTGDAVAGLPLEVKIGQLIIAGVTDTEVGDDSRHIIADLHIGNIILMGRNFDSPEQVLALTRGLQDLALDANGIPLIIGTDQEGGLVQRASYYAGFTPMPPAQLAGAADDPALMERYGQMVGSELAAVGVGLDFAPVFDVNDNPTNPVIGSLGRSFGTTPEAVESSALPFLAGLEAAGVIGVGKHFPGHGSTTTDSHLDLPFVDKDRADLEAVDIAPFAAAVEAGIPAIMPAHVVYTALDPVLPATLSAPIQTGLLRDQLGFDGVIITDDMGMAGIMQIAPPEESGVRAILAGADMLICVRMDISGACAPEMIEQLHAGLLAAVEDGRLTEKRIDESVRRILALKAAYGAGPAPGDNLDILQSPDHLRVIADIYTAVADRRAEDR
ncbi:MAG: beta-N-acetylhexosaminidase [Chloroflexota bacterium]|nr:beta-N-acetylhexosaminidase [Chloroflexota bacterium]